MICVVCVNNIGLIVFNVVAYIVVMTLLFILPEMAIIPLPNL